MDNHHNSERGQKQAGLWAIGSTLLYWQLFGGAPLGIMSTVEHAPRGSFKRALLGRTGLEVGRLGVAASYGVPGTALEWAFERGVDYIYWGKMSWRG